MNRLKLNMILIKLEEVEHSTESGIILDQNGDRFVSYGSVYQDSYVVDENDPNKELIVIPAGTRIMYSKDKYIPIKDNLAIVEYKNIIAWGDNLEF